MNMLYPISETVILNLLQVSEIVSEHNGVGTVIMSSSNLYIINTDQMVDMIELIREYYNQEYSR